MNELNEKSKTPVRILHVVSAMNPGGIQKMILNNYEKIDRTKIQFDFLSHSTEESFYDDKIRKMGGRILYSKRLGEIGPVKYFYNIRNIIKLNGPYHAIHSHNLHQNGIVLLAAKMTNIKKRISHIHSSDYGGDNRNKKLFKVFFNFMRFLTKFSATDHLVCSSNAGKYFYGQKYFNTNHVKVFPNSIDLREFNDVSVTEIENLKNSFSIESNNIVIGHVGRFTFEKNHEFLISFAKKFVEKYPQAIFILIGDGPLRTGFENKIKEYKLENNIKILGVREDIPAWLKLMDILLLPSLFEGLGIVAIEAQAAGTPCVLSNNVPSETDLGLGILKYLSLDDPIEIWEKTVLELIKENSVKYEIIEERFIEKDYTIEKSVLNLSKIYLSEPYGHKYIT